ncbi:MAG: hypothetical protein VKK04_10840 [Synechococcales bacterium]|nr:hypothetical protein [Synechococcales bacterium]
MAPAASTHCAAESARQFSAGNGRSPIILKSGNIGEAIAPTQDAVILVRYANWREGDRPCDLLKAHPPQS